MKKWRASYASGVLLATLALMIPSVAGAIGTGSLDQAMTSVNNGGTDVGGCNPQGCQEVAQTFTAGRSGALTQVQLLVTPEVGHDFCEDTFPTPDLVVTIRDTTSGVPNSSALATATVAASSIQFDTGGNVLPTTVTFDSPAAVTAGRVYAIVMSAPATVSTTCRSYEAGWYGTQSFTFGPDFLNNFPDPYPGGMACSHGADTTTFSCVSGVDGQDYYFETFVATLSPMDCKGGGWSTYGNFRNQGDCVSFVATGGRNLAG